MDRHGGAMITTPRRALATTALAALMSLAPAMGQKALAQQPAVSFSIAGGALDTALSRFGAASGMQVLYSSAVTKGLTTPGVSGSLSPEAALSRLLSGTGLSYRFTGPKSVTIATPAATTQGGAAPVGALQLQEIVVSGAGDGTKSYVVEDSATATKTDTPLIETPQSVSVVGRKQIDAQNAQSVTEILRYVPGVNIETYGPDPKGYDWIMMRGFNAQSTSNYQNGLRLLSSGYTFFRTDPYQLQTLEVLRGPSSSLYGNSDAGGLVNRVTKKPTADPVREIELEFGNNRRLQGAFDFSGTIANDPSLLYRVIGVARDSNTQFEYSDGSEIADDRLMLAPSFTWAPSADTTLTIDGDFLRDKSGGTVISYTPEDILIGDPGFNRSKQEQASIGYQFEHRFNEDWTVRQNLRYGHVNFLLDNLILSGLDTSSGQLLRTPRRFDESFDAFAVDNQALTNFGTGAIRHELLLGLDYAWSRADVNHYTGSVVPLNPANPTYRVPIPTPTAPLNSYLERYQQIGLYAQDQIWLTDNLLATLGGRYDWLTLENENRLLNTTTDIDVGNFSGRAGLTYLTEWRVAPYVSFSQSFVPNPGLSATGETFDPSDSRQWEVGVKYQPQGFEALFTLAYFDIVKSNVLTQDLVNTGFNVATGEVKSSGVEVEGKFNLAESWDFTGSYSWTDAEISKDNRGNVGRRPSLVPAHQASAWLNYTFYSGMLEGLSLGGGVRFVGSSFGDNANSIEVDARTVFDAGMSYKMNEHATLSVNATNLFDKQYFTTCNPAYSCYEGDRRSVIGRLKVNF